MRFYDFIGYDKEGSITEIPTTLNKSKLGTIEVTLAALGFNAPAWVAVSSMPILYAIVGHAAPLAIMIAYFFPMLVLVFCMMYLTRRAPYAGGVFTFSERFIHPHAGTILGWAYIINCIAVQAMTAVIGAQYIQALIPAVKGELAAKIIGTIMLLVFLFVSLRGVEITAKVAGVFLLFEITIVAGLGILGIINPQVQDLSFSSLYSVADAGGWSAVGPGVLFGLWMLANFDSSINLIEEAKTPVRTVQRSMLLVLSSAFVIYSLAAIGWQYAVPINKLVAIVESGDGGAIAALANVYLPASLSWIAIFVVITSCCAGLQISSVSGVRVAYRMSQEGHLPRVFGKVNQYKVPWVTSVVVALVGIALVWYKPIAQLQWYYDVVTIALVLSYMSGAVAYIFVSFKRFNAGGAILASILPLLAMVALGYIAYTAGAVPPNPDDLYQAWYIGVGIIITGICLVVYGRFKKKQKLDHDNMVATSDLE